MTGAETNVGQRCDHWKTGLDSLVPYTVPAVGGPRCRANDYEFSARRHHATFRGSRAPQARRVAGFHLGAWGLGAEVRGADITPPTGGSFIGKHDAEATTTSSLDRRGRGATASAGGEQDFYVYSTEASQAVMEDGDGYESRPG